MLIGACDSGVMTISIISRGPSTPPPQKKIGIKALLPPLSLIQATGVRQIDLTYRYDADHETRRKDQLRKCAKRTFLQINEEALLIQVNTAHPSLYGSCTSRRVGVSPHRTAPPRHHLAFSPCRSVPTQRCRSRVAAVTHECPPSPPPIQGNGPRLMGGPSAGGGRLA